MKLYEPPSIFGKAHDHVPSSRMNGTDKRVMAKRLAGLATATACLLLLTSCGILGALACMGTPAALVISLEPEVLELARGSSGSVEVTVTGLSQHCFPKATGVNLVGLPGGVTAEPLGLTSRQNSGLLTVTVEASAVPGSYLLEVRNSAYHDNRPRLTLVVSGS